MNIPESRYTLETQICIKIHIVSPKNLLQVFKKINPFFIKQNQRSIFNPIILNNPHINKSNVKKLKYEHNPLSLQSEISLNKNSF